MLDTKSPTDAVAVWHDQSTNFKKLVDKWANSLSTKIVDHDDLTNTDQRLGGESWHYMTWGETLLLALKKLQLLLILSPHPDDLELSCGLLCHQAMLLGWRLHEIILTDGSAGGIDTTIFHTDQLRQLRIAEARSGGALLGVEEIEFWGFPDSKLNLNLEPAISLLQNKLEILSPNILVFPSPSDTHPDHSGTHMVAMSTLEKYQNEFATLQYCFWGKDKNQNIVLTHEPGVLVKEGAIRQHKTQPIDQYLGRLYREEKRIDGYEQYYSPNPEKTVSVLSHYGFNIKLT